MFKANSNELHKEGTRMGARRNFSRGSKPLGGGAQKKSVKGGPHIFLGKL